jgi:hypothetical protein
MTKVTTTSMIMHKETTTVPMLFIIIIIVKQNYPAEKRDSGGTYTNGYQPQLW